MMLYGGFNKDAPPFYPVNYGFRSLLKFEALPVESLQSDLHKLIRDAIESAEWLQDTSSKDFSILEYDDELNKATGENEGKFAMVAVNLMRTAEFLARKLNDFEWKDRRISVFLVDDVSDLERSVNNVPGSYGGGFYPPLPYGIPGPMNRNFMTGPSFPAWPPVYASLLNSRYTTSKRPQNRSPLVKHNEKMLTSFKSNSDSPLKPLPPFIMNLVNKGSHSSEPTSSDEISKDSPDASTGPEISKNLNSTNVDNYDIDDAKVNPCRLFIGNIPFSSTWMSLKNFLIERAEEIEPGNNIEILRVEIPMQIPSMHSNPSGASGSRVNSGTSLHKYKSRRSLSNSPEMVKMRLPDPTFQGKGMSRGFAIVTTANKESLDKLIRYFDNVDFEGRSLTVRYDKYPDFNNYVLQQLNPGQSNRRNTKPSVISNLAFERNLFQQQFYYSNSTGHLHSSTMPYPLYNSSLMYPSNMQYVPASYGSQYPGFQPSHKYYYYSNIPKPSGVSFRAKRHDYQENGTRNEQINQYLGSRDIPNLTSLPQSPSFSQHSLKEDGVDDDFLNKPLPETLNEEERVHDVVQSFISLDFSAS